MLRQKEILPILRNELNRNFGQTGFRSLAKQLLTEWVFDYPVRGFLVGVGYAAGGGGTSDIVAIAAAVELAQLASVIIDDVIDKSEIRIGQSAYKRFGEDVCIMAGDILKTCASSVFVQWVAAKKLSARGMKALQCFESTYRDVCLGQLLDISFEGSRLIRESKYLAMISYTTAGFLRGAIDVGAILAGVPQPVARTLREYAWSLGMAFQIYDDVLDLLPQQCQLKAHAQDIRRCKQRLPLIHYLQNCNKREKASAEAILRQRQLSESDVRTLTHAITESGALGSAIQKGKEFSLAAKRQALRLPMEPYRTLLLEFVDFLQPEMDEAISGSAHKTLIRVAR